MMTHATKQFSKLNRNTNTGNGTGSRHGQLLAFTNTTRWTTNSESTTIDPDYLRYQKIFIKDSKIISIDSFTIVLFHNWFDNLQTTQKSLAIEYEGDNYRHRLRFFTRGPTSTGRMVSIIGTGKDKRTQLYNIIQQLNGRTVFQMMEGGLDGVVETSEAIASNTTITETTSDTTAGVSEIGGIIRGMSSTEPQYEMSKLTDRFELCLSDNIERDKDYKKTLLIPRDLFTDARAASANLSLFRNFVYSELELEFRIVVNAPKFGQGRLIVGWFPDSHDDVHSLYNDYESLIQRQHAFIDLNANNDAIIRVPQNIRRSFLRNTNHSTAHDASIVGEMAALQIATLVNYTSSTTQPATIPIQIFYRFVKANFYGMSFAVNPQMDLVDIVADYVPPVKTAERLLRRTGWIGNQDKPFLNDNKIFTPTPRREFSSGCGLSDSIPLFFDRAATVSTVSEYMNPTDPTNTMDVAKRFGYLGRFEWPTTKNNGEILWEWFVSPTSRAGMETVPQLETKRSGDRRPTPLDYISSQYAFYRGTIKLKFYFICTAFHTGTIQFEISYNRISNSLDDMASTYTRTFDLIEDREFELEIPFIYDTPWRRTMTQFQWPAPMCDQPDAADGSKMHGLFGGGDYLSHSQMYPPATEFISNTRLTARCINPLTPIDSVAKNVTVIALIAGGDDYELNAILPNFYVNPSYATLKENQNYSGQVHNLHQFPIFYDNLYDNNEVPKIQRVPNIKAKSVDKRAMASAISHETFSDSILSAARNRGNNQVRAVAFNGRGEPLYKDVMNATQIAAYKKRTGHEPDAAPMHTVSMAYIKHQGPSGRFAHFHNTDQQYEFKTLMRRNYLMWSGSLSARDSGSQVMWRAPHWQPPDTADFWYDTHSRLYIPVHPPTHLICAQQFRRCWSSSISTIPTMYRHWRGSMRFTIICRRNTGDPVYISYLPNMGVTYLGNKVNGHKLTAINGSSKSWTGRDWRTQHAEQIASTGLATEILVPSVNTSASITVPFDTMFNRCVTGVRADRGDDSTMPRTMAREESTFHSGHLILESETSTDIDIFISAGDDFQLMNYIGNLRYNGSVIYSIADDYQRTEKKENVDSKFFQIEQISGDTKFVPTPVLIDSYTRYTVVEPQMMHFNLLGKDLEEKIADGIEHLEHTSTVVDRSVRDIATDFGKITDNVDSLVEHSDAIVGSIRRTENEIGRMARKSGEVSDNFMSHLQKISNNFERVTEKTEEMGDSIKNVMDLLAPAVEKTANLFDAKSSVAQRAFSYSRDFIFDLVLLLRNFDYTNFGIMFVKYVAKVLDVGFETMLHFGEKLAILLKKLCGRSPKEQGSGDDSTKASLFGFFVSMLANVMKITCLQDKKHYEFGSKFKDYIFDGRNVQYMNQVIALVERVFKIFLNSVRYVQKYGDTEETVREILKREQTDIERFCVEVEQITDPSNSRIAQRADVKAKTWRNFMYAKYLMKKMVQCTGNPASAVIMKYISKINHYCEQNWNKLACCPVRYEPRVYCFAGKSNVGKSYLSRELIMQMLSSIGYKRIGCNPIFVRAPGRKHWDGFSLDKQAVVFDDWMNISNAEQVVEQVSDLYELKSTCDFLPAMAAVDEKGIRANPRMVVLLTNSPFPHSSITTVCNTSEAVYRRRDKLVWVRRLSQYENSDLRKDLTEEESSNFKHLEFAFGDSRTTHDETDSSLKWMSYEAMSKLLTDDFTDYNATEMKHVKRRLDLLCADLPMEIRECIDPMEIYSMRQFESQLLDTEFEKSLPSEQLEQHVRECLDILGRKHANQQKPEPQGDGQDVLDYFREFREELQEDSEKDLKMRRQERIRELLKPETSAYDLHHGLDALNRYKFKTPIWKVIRMLDPCALSHGDYHEKLYDYMSLHFNDKFYKDMVCPMCVINDADKKQKILQKFDLLDESVREFPKFAQCERHQSFYDENPRVMFGKIGGMEHEERCSLANFLNCHTDDFELKPMTANILEMGRIFRSAILHDIDRYVIFGTAHKLTLTKTEDIEKFMGKISSADAIAAPFFYTIWFSQTMEEYSEVKLSREQLMTIMQSSLVRGSNCVKITIYPTNSFQKYDINNLDLRAAEFCVKYESRRREVPWCASKKLNIRVDVTEDNDEQFPDWEFSGYNEMGYSPSMRELYRRNMTSTRWLRDFMYGREETYLNGTEGARVDASSNSNGLAEPDNREPTFSVRYIKNDNNDIEVDKIRLSLGSDPNAILDDNSAEWADIEFTAANGEKTYAHTAWQNPFLSTRRMEQIPRCCHCNKYSFFQYGDSKHHVCIGCYKEDGTCDYCLTYDARANRDKMYKPAFWAMLLNYRQLAGKWTRRLIQFLLSVGALAIAAGVLYIFTTMGLKIGRGIIAMTGLGKFDFMPKHEGKCEFYGPNFLDYIYANNAEVPTVEKLGDGIYCQHRLMLNEKPEDVTYYHERWTFTHTNNDMEREMTIPATACAGLSCYLKSAEGFTRYQAFCVKWIEINKAMLDMAMSSTVARIIQLVPYFACDPTHEAYTHYNFVKTKNSSIFSSIKKWMKVMYTVVGNPSDSWPRILITCGLAIGAIIISVKAVFGLVGWIGSKFKSKPSTTDDDDDEEQNCNEEQSVPPGYSRADSTRHFKRKQNPNPKTKPRWNKTAESKNNEQQSQAQYFASLSKYIHRNQLIFELWVNGLKQSTAFTAVGIRNRAALMPKHYYTALQRAHESKIPGLEIRLFQPYYPAIKTRNYVFDPVDFVVSDNSDVCLFFAPKTVGEFVNITKYIQRESDCERALPANGIFLRCSSNENPNLREIDVRLIGFEKEVELCTGERYADILAYEYSEPGACGSLVLKRNSTRPIIAMHFAGTNASSWVTRGYGMVISQETFADIDFGDVPIERLEPETTYPVEDAILKMNPEFVQVQSLFAYEDEVHLSYASKIRKSLLNHYDGDPKTRPCFLSGKDADYPHEISPMVAGIAKHGQLTKNFSTSFVNEVRDMLYDAKYSQMKPSMASPHRLTPAEAIRGFDIPGYEPMKLNTSMGFPWVFTPNKQKKDYILVTEEQELEQRKVFVSKRVMDAVMIDEADRLAGKIPFLPWIDELKDERRQFAKVFKLGGTRIFCMSSFSTTLATRQNFLHFAAAYKNSRFTMQHAVGVSRDGPGWSIIANSLLANSNKIICLDYSNFGPGYNAMFCAAAHDIIQRWTTEHVSGVNQMEMTILGEEHYNSTHIAGDLVYQQLSGGPSGDALTVIKNGLVDELYILAIWKLLAERNKYVPVESLYADFFNRVRLFTYGDDIIMSVSDELIEWFNGETIISAFAEYDIKVTMADKTGNVVKYLSIEQATFLKSGFVRHPIHFREWLAPIDEISITECPRWIFSSDNHELATLVNCDQAIRLAYGHGEDYFTKFRNKINDAMREKGLNPILLQWKELDKNFFPDYY